MLIFIYLKKYHIINMFTLMRNFTMDSYCHESTQISLNLYLKNKNTYQSHPSCGKTNRKLL